MLFVDLDGFKRVNDAHGHSAGDELLRIVAGRLARCVRGGDLVARLGGDEFVVLSRVSAREAHMLARRIEGKVREPVSLAEGTVCVGASVGVAASATGTASASDLLGAADEAMYRNKRAAAPAELSAAALGTG